MRVYKIVGLREPQTLRDGSTVDKLVAGPDITIRSSPPHEGPLRLIVDGPWGRFERDWESVGAVAQDVDWEVGPHPHTVVRLDRAQQLVEYLEAGFVDNRYLYRGVSSAEHPLLPNALRTEPNRLPFGEVLKTDREQAQREFRVAKDFYQATYHQGLTIPNWAEVDRIMSEAAPSGGMLGGWPPDPVEEFLAIAQHHGVPTRLLDWTLDPLVAAYFAAWDWENAAAEVAVWILDRQADWVPGSPRRGRIINPIAVPYDVNRNAHAQRGVFTLHERVDAFSDQEPSRMPLDQLLSRYAILDPPDGLRKVTMPSTELAALLRLLDRRRVSGATMFPGYSGAARAARERALWSP